MKERSATLSAEEAHQALAAVRQVELATRRAIRMRGGGPIVMLWGVVWMVGYLGGHFLPGPATGAVWALADLAGIAGTLAIVARARPRVRSSGGWRIGLFWLSLLLFSALFVWLAQPLGYEQTGLLIALLMMFGYVTMGVFIDRAFFWTGLAVTVLAVAGYLAAPGAFNLWMAVLGGGTLFGSGLYIHRRWG